MKNINRFTALYSAAILFLMGGMASPALAHGYVSSPTSRTVLCQKGINTACGAAQYEPQSIEGPKGFPAGGPADGTLASGGNARFSELNQQSPTRWARVALHSGTNTFTWNLTAQHRTTSWQYFITRQGWDASKPLTRSDFELTPFCTVMGNDQVPPYKFSHTCTLPADRTGYHVILAVWNIADTGNAFYQAIDVNISR